MQFRSFSFGPRSISPATYRSTIMRVILSGTSRFRPTITAKHLDRVVARCKATLRFPIDVAFNVAAVIDVIVCGTYNWESTLARSRFDPVLSYSAWPAGLRWDFVSRRRTIVCSSRFVEPVLANKGSDASETVSVGWNEFRNGSSLSEKIMASGKPVRTGRRHMFNSKRQLKMSNPTANAKRGMGDIGKLQHRLPAGDIRTLVLALANHSAEKPTRVCVRLIACTSRHGVSRPC